MNTRIPINFGIAFRALPMTALGILACAAPLYAQTDNGGQGAPPRIVATSPKVGDTEVDPGLTEITVTFDRDMAGGFSWTGGGADYPSGREGERPHWRDKRTCVMPVTLKPGRYYRVGINSPSYRNFRSEQGVSAAPSAIFFTTKGASPEVKRRAMQPLVVQMVPPNGAKDVDPGITDIKVTFSMPMGGGFSWTGGGPQFPGAEGKRAYWTPDHKTCVLPVQLAPGQTYRVGLNSVSFKNFRSAEGVPLEPLVYTFTTK